MPASASTVDIHDELLVIKPGKWTLVVVTYLREERHRFNELRRGINGISQKTLTSTLRDLERDGIISRTHYPSIPPRVDYELTELGQAFLEMADAWRRFAAKHRDRVLAARMRFDTAGDETVIRLVSGQ